jgi:hypothetical protein
VKWRGRLQGMGKNVFHVGALGKGQ